MKKGVRIAGKHGKTEVTEKNSKQFQGYTCFPRRGRVS
jgi:hypothetical protein